MMIPVRSLLRSEIMFYDPLAAIAELQHEPGYLCATWGFSARCEATAKVLKVLVVCKVVNIMLIFRKQRTPSGR